MDDLVISFHLASLEGLPMPDLSDAKTLGELGRLSCRVEGLKRRGVLRAD